MINCPNVSGVAGDIADAYFAFATVDRIRFMVEVDGHYISAHYDFPKWKVEVYDQYTDIMAKPTQVLTGFKAEDVVTSALKVMNEGNIVLAKYHSRYGHEYDYRAGKWVELY